MFKTKFNIFQYIITYDIIFNMKIKDKMKDFFIKKITFFICLIIIVICSLLAFFNVFTNLDNLEYDLLLKITPEIDISQDVLFCDIDDSSLDEIGTWPWTRDILADTIIRMKELGASGVTFDIDYVSASQHGINPESVNIIPSIVNENKNTVTSIMQQLAEATVSGQIELEHLLDMNSSLLETDIIPSYEKLEQAINDISRDNDDYFGRALQFFGNSWLTINYSNIKTSSEEDLAYTKKRFLLENVLDNNNLIEKTNNFTFANNDALVKGFSPALSVLMRRANGAGFPNMKVDEDGTRRRVELLYKENDKYIPQLILAPLLKKFDVQFIERVDNKIVLKGAIFPNSKTRKDIEIPVDRNGYMLINWLHKDFLSSFKHVPVISILHLDDMEEKIYTCIDWLYNDLYILAADGSWLSYFVGAEQLFNEYNNLNLIKKDFMARCEGYNEIGKPISKPITEEEYKKYYKNRANFFDNCRTYIESGCLKEIEDRLTELASEGISQEEIDNVRNITTEVFTALKDNLDIYQRNFSELQSYFQNAFCIIGNTATGNVDVGKTPFESYYPNVGTHGNIYNTIINDDFITPIKWEISFIFAIIFVLIFSWFNNKRNKNIILIGIFGIISFPLIAFCLMLFGSIFLPISAAFITIILSFIVAIICQFVNSEQDKKFLKHAFATYLSENVVEEIVSNPEKLALGGEEKNITALFTDIKGFSSLSEKVSPEKLVSILNEYLTLMSNIILEYQGTIDKYIGDAIVSFFGAPNELEDHAYRACAVAIKIKQAEKEFNRKLIDQNILTEPIQTRIGINTGKMVVGNMGTDRKMNYTIMGNNVNIASRLEGVNKAYSSWILVSEKTWNEADRGLNKGKLIARKIDKVRVMGINEPIQLYNIMGFDSEMTENEKTSISCFHTALELYFSRKFPDAIEFFHRAAILNPKDSVPSVFIKRCKKYIENPPAADWTGVMTMLSK